MVRALHERGNTPDLLAGTSVGALNAAFPASRPPTVATGELAAIWRGLRRSDILPLRSRMVWGLGTMRSRISAKP
jgi:NTE family protein